MFVWLGQAIERYMHTGFIMHSLTTASKLRCVGKLHGLHFAAGRSRETLK